MCSALWWVLFRRSAAVYLPNRYFEERFGVDSGALGYITSYTALLSFVVQVGACFVVVLLLSCRLRSCAEGWEKRSSLLVPAGIAHLTLHRKHAHAHTR